MCGIAGIYGKKDNELLSLLSKNMLHRGPDGEGRYLDNHLSMVIRRLAIIDLKSGDQPKFNEDKSIIVTFNGEIYNFKELQSILKGLGHEINTNSDTEIIAHAYEEWGVNSFDKFDGMFGIALYDKNKSKFYLVRDQFGIKPLYYTILDKTKNLQILYSSELKPILKSGLIKSVPNDKIIYRYLKFRVHDDNKETFFKRIYKLMPGEYLEIYKERIIIKKYSSINESIYRNAKSEISGNEIKTFFDLLNNSVKNRLISDVPVGTCLSGGLDSSTIVSLVNQYMLKQNTFSAVFPGSVNNEEKYVESLLKNKKNISSHKIYPNHKDFIKDIKDFVRTQEEPTISSGPYAQYKVMQKAKEHVKVILDGQGSDEMLAGYNPYYLVYFRQLFKQKKYLLLFKELIFSLDIILKIFRQARKNNNIVFINKNFSSRYKDEIFKPTKDNLKQRLYEDVFYNSLPALLRYEDKNAMRFSIEGRIPFCESRLFKFIFSLNDNLIIRNGVNKFILRKATKKIIPSEIRLRRNKIGFTTPEDEWLLKNYDYVYKVFSSDLFGKRKYFNQLNILIALNKFKKNNFNDTLYLWRLLNLELWLREFVDPPSFRLSSELRRGKAKKIELKVSGKIYYRFPIKTDLFKKGDDYVSLIGKYVIEFLDKLNKEKKYKNILKNKFFVVVSEKIIAISQGRSYFVWNIKPSQMANILSKYVTKTSYGIGLGSPWTMQLAINEVGIFRILFATGVSVVSKLFGIKGMFYNIAGSVVRSIDGPTEYSLYPSNLSAKLGPKNPQEVAEKFKLQIPNFLGTSIIDANDLGQNVLANSTNLPDLLIENIFKDNPMGQTNEQTPISLVFLST